MLRKIKRRRSFDNLKLTNKFKENRLYERKNRIESEIEKLSIFKTFDFEEIFAGVNK